MKYKKVKNTTYKNVQVILRKPPVQFVDLHVHVCIQEIRWTCVYEYTNWRFY